MIQSVNLPPSAYTITSSAHCSILQPSAAYSQISSAHTTAAITSSVHTLQQPLHLQCTLQPCTTMYSYLQPISSAHYSYTIQWTLQLYHPVHTAATLLYQYHTVHLVKKGKPIPLLAYLQSSP